MDPFLGHGAAVRDFLEQLRRAAESEASVLLTGESGAGKSRAAERLHRWSPRSAGPFVAISLAATAGSLIEATLFGHEQGAFTDARRSRTGVFRRANGGTLLLDDIDHLPLEAQVKLLRVLQEREIEPLGAEASLPIDVRVVATSVAPERAVQLGRLREDLFYRMAVVPLEVPPLRRRLEDLEELSRGLIATISARDAVPSRPLSPQALERLQAHSWPGNVRELENALERVLVLGAGRDTGGRPIEAEELAFLGQGREEAVDDVARAALALGLTVDAVARAMMERALREQRGNLSAAARAVGLTRRAFDYRMGRADGEHVDEGGPA